MTMTLERPRSEAAKKRPRAAADSEQRTVKRSITIPMNLAREIDEQVGPREFSAFVTAAVERELEHQRLGELLDYLTEEYGEVPADVQAEVDAQWDAVRQ